MWTIKVVKVKLSLSFTRKTKSSNLVVMAEDYWKIDTWNQEWEHGRDFPNGDNHHLLLTVWVWEFCCCWFIFFLVQWVDCVVMGSYRPVHKASSLQRLDTSTGTSWACHNMSLPGRVPQTHFNFLTRAIALGHSLVYSLVCISLKLPFEKLIFRMGFGRTNRAPMRAHIPHWEGYEKKTGRKIQQQVQK